MDVEHSAGRFRRNRSLIAWSLLTMALVAVCAVLVSADPRGFGADHLWVNTDYRTKLAPFYDGKKIFGQWALLENQWDAEQIKTRCPDLTDEIPMNNQGRNGKDIIEIDLDGHRYCILQGETVTVDDLEIGLVGISRDWVSMPDPATGEQIPFGNAELTLQRTNQPLLATGLLLATALVGVTLAKLIDTVTAGSSKNRTSRRNELNDTVH
ncbi:hypothetical protein AB0F81_06635 [Actinoplanes sp. NPDC024001]|uniref:hypothetical protein n=1 Tax=Actinoplanes sp. NPDC024001 TaxID=3154598 RepID=UPI0033FD8985